MATKGITKETAIKVWNLKKSGVGFGTIADTYNISVATIHRIIRAFITYNERPHELALLDPNQYGKFVEFAREIFPAKEETATQEKTSSHDNTALLLEVLENLKKQTSMMEAICKELGI